MTAARTRSARDEAALRARHEEFAETRSSALREQLVLEYGDLARYLARKFAFRGEPLEDLIQVAHLGLLQAVDRFDPTRGVQFVTFATTTVVGEIKRHFRDKLWSVHVPRRLRELNNTLMRAAERLATSHGRTPTIQELATDAGVSFEEAVEALEVGRAYSPASLDAEVAGAEDDDATPLREHIGTLDPSFDHVEDRQAIDLAIARLPERERRVLQMRYYDERSQADIARELSISQMHVSRIQRTALRRMKDLLTHRPES
jgi:RNA polymerase sigma-B factor